MSHSDNFAGRCAGPSSIHIHIRRMVFGKFRFCLRYLYPAPGLRLLDREGKCRVVDFALLYARGDVEELMSQQAVVNVHVRRRIC